MTSTGEPLAIEASHPAPGCCVLRLVGEIDILTAQTLTTALQDAAADRPRVVVELAGVSFIDSSGVNTLVVAHRAVTGAGGALVLAAPTPMTRRVFEISRLPDVVPVHDSVDVALAELTRGAG